VEVTPPEEEQQREMSSCRVRGRAGRTGTEGPNMSTVFVHLGLSLDGFICIDIAPVLLARG
jgi:hypothetical protein